MAITNLQIADEAVVVTPNDSTVLNAGVLYVGTGGDVTVDTLNSTNKTFKNVADGSILYVMVTKVYATGTTADDLLILS